MTKRESGIAVVILAMVAASMALVFWGMELDRGASRIGPIRSLSAGGQDHLAVFHGNRLHLLDAAGRRVGSQSLGDLSLNEEPNDMDWTVDASGTTQAWFIEDMPPRLVRCDLAQPGLKLERCAQVAAGGQLKAIDRSRAIHIAVDVQRNRLFIADAKGHAVRALTLDGKLVATSMAGDLFFPNRLRLAGEMLMVADNDHHRLAWMDVGADQPSFAVRRTLQSSAHPQAVNGHTKVTDFAFVPGADGQPSVLWMLAVAQGQDDGDVLTWGGDMKPGVRADLGDFSDPLGIDRIGGAAVVADFNGVGLFRVGTHGKNLGPFGDDGFQRELRASRDRIADGAMWVRAGWAAFAVTLAVGFLLAWRYGEKPGRQAAQPVLAGVAEARAEVPRHPVELKPQDWYGRQVGWAAAMALAAAVLVPLVGWFVLRDQIPPALLTGPNRWTLVGMGITLLLLMPFTLWRVRQMTRRTIVLDAGTVQVHASSGMTAVAPVAEVLASPQSLLIGRVMLAYRGQTASGKPGRWIYDEDLITRYLLAHLPASQRVAQPELGRAMLKRMSRWQMLVIAVPALAYAAFELWRIWGKA